MTQIVEHKPDAVAEGRPWAHGIAYVGDAFVPAAEARVSIFDHSFLYGDGAFESIVFRNGRTFAFDAHVDRLLDSCAYLKLTFPIAVEDIRRISGELIERNEMSAGYLRIVVSRGEGYPLSDPRRTSGALLVLSVQGTPPYGDRSGVRLITASTRRTPAASLDPKAKLNNYGNHIVAKLEAIGAGADDALMLDTRGDVAELPGCNIFLVKQHELATPAAGSILLGITRRTVLQLGNSGQVDGIDRVSERRVTPFELYSADEVFVTGTGTGLAHVSEVDGRPIGAGPAGVTTQLARLYDELLDQGGELES